MHNIDRRRAERWRWSYYRGAGKGLGEDIIETHYFGMQKCVRSLFSCLGCFITVSDIIRKIASRYIYVICVER